MAKRRLEEVEDDLLVRASVPIHMRHKVEGNEIRAIQAKLPETIWYYCDVCWQGIKPLESRFDCLVCADHTECKGCVSSQTHEHKLKRFVVPEGCVPPSDEEIEKTLNLFRFCDTCKNKVTHSEVYYENKKSPEMVVCNSCINLLNKEFRLRDFAEKMPVAKKKLNIADEELEEAIQDCLNVDFEDVIAGEIKTKYQYVDVEQEDFGLTEAELLYADDKILNKMLSMKKLAPFREGGINQQDRTKMRKMRTLVRESAEKNMGKMQLEMALMGEEDELKEMSKKGGKYKVKYEKFMEEKKDRIDEIYEEEEKEVKVIRPIVRENQPQVAEHDVMEQEEVGKKKERKEDKGRKREVVAKSRLNTYGL